MQHWEVGRSFTLWARFNRNISCWQLYTYMYHDDVIKWKHFSRYSPLCGEFTGDRWTPLTKASDAEFWCFLWSAPWINGWVNNRESGALRRHCAHYDVTVMWCPIFRKVHTMEQERYSICCIPLQSYMKILFVYNNDFMYPVPVTAGAYPTLDCRRHQSYPFISCNHIKYEENHTHRWINV